MVDLKEGDFIVIFEKDGSTHIRGRIDKKEAKMLKDTQFVDLVLDTGEKIRKIWNTPNKVLNSRIYYEFENLMFSLEHLFGTPIFLLMRLLPSSHLASPYCYICKKDWFQILVEGLARRYKRFQK